MQSRSFSRFVPHFNITDPTKTLSSIYKSVKPIHIACKIVGLEPFSFAEDKEGNLSVEHSKHDFIYHLFFNSLFTILGGYTTAAFFMDQENNTKTSISRNKFVILITIMILLMFLITSANYFMRMKLSSSLVAFSKIDNVLLRFDMKINYEALRKDNLGLMILMFSSITVRSIILILLINLDVLQSLTIIIAFTVKALTKYQFISFVRQLNIRFMRVNDGLQEIFNRNTNNKIILNQLDQWDDLSDQLFIMCRIHYKLCHWLRILNKAFGLQQLTSIAVSVFNILFQAYYLYYVLSGREKKTVISIVSPLIWTLDELMEIQFLVSACAETSDNANTTPSILHEMRNLHYNADLEDNVQSYSLQMLHQKIQFSAMGYFVIDYTLSYSIIGAVTTYLVIFIQFDQGQKIKSEKVGNTSHKSTATYMTPASGVVV
ncbi:hypothetical protein WA026_023141 [Henosepilachna vigintioctopunctata]|uniref:Gustatory receptor n=1 Tax=Henosepilachna vigintioctopunctata TaxID=420089 RepID=A0AAW1TYA7_9CUCU